MNKCDMNCFQCIYEDCVNDFVRPAYESSRWRNFTPEQKKRYTAQKKEKRHERTKAGLCFKCGKKATRGVYCIDCYVKRRKYRESKKQKNKHTVWKEKGLCFFCGNEKMQGHEVCEKCYTREKENIERCLKHENSVKARKEFKRKVFNLSREAEDGKRNCES